MLIQDKFKIGVIALLVSALLTSISQVFYANRVQTIHPFLFTGISFFITLLYFQFIAMRQKVDRKWGISWQPLVKLNIASAVTFMGYYFALKYIEPAIVSSLEMGVGPLFILLIYIFQKQKIIKEQWGIAIVTLFSCVLLIWAVVVGNSGVDFEFSTEVFVGILASILCGAGAVLCTIYSKQLSENGWTSSMILSKRFFGIVILSFVFTYDLIVPYFKEHIVWILIVTFFGVLLPMYFLQKGIQLTNTFLVMMSLCFIPVFTFFLQLFDARITFSYPTFFGVVLLFVVGIYSIVVERKQV